jgi:LytS/YehU family sensor histidine kinase
LQTKIDAAPGTLMLKLPPFLLLPLVENAIKYGTRTSEEVVRVIVTARPLGASGLFIEVANTGLWVEPTGTRTPFSTGIGLENLKERLQRYFPGAHEFSTSAADGWVRATLRITSTENLNPALEHAQSPAH